MEFVQLRDIVWVSVIAFDHNYDWFCVLLVSSEVWSTDQAISLYYLFSNNNNNNMVLNPFNNDEASEMAMVW